MAVGPFVHRAVSDPRAPPTGELERPVDTARRLLILDAAVIGGVVLWSLIVGTPWILGFVFGNGVLLSMSAWSWHRWESRHDSRLLHEARLTWSRKERFFAVASREPSIATT